nr:unnamed protein product [Spirometra erinaceieuropaei]
MKQETIQLKHLFCFTALKLRGTNHKHFGPDYSCRTSIRTVDLSTNEQNNTECIQTEIGESSLARSFCNKDKNVGTGLVGAPACGDVMKLQIKVDDEGRIIDAKFKTFGCGSAIASSSLATEWVKGKTVDEATTIKNTEIAKELKLPPVKLHCSMLAEDAIKAAVSDLKAKQRSSS